MRIFLGLAVLGTASLISAQTAPPRRAPEQTTTQPELKTRPSSSSSSPGSESGSDQDNSKAQVPNDDGVRSSKDTKNDLSPPPNDAAKHPDSSSAGGDDEEDVSGVMEVKKWDPHRAEKDVEVGDFYFKRKNYSAALSRYREALEYK